MMEEMLTDRSHSPQPAVSCKDYAARLYETRPIYTKSDEDMCVEQRTQGSFIIRLTMTEYACLADPIKLRCFRANRDGYKFAAAIP
jgi:hypothetical protein